MSVAYQMGHTTEDLTGKYKLLVFILVILKLYFLKAEILTFMDFKKKIVKFYYPYIFANFDFYYLREFIIINI